MSRMSRRAWSFDKRNQIKIITPVVPVPIKIKNTFVNGNLIVSDDILCKSTEKINTGTETTTTSITIPTPDYLNEYPNYDPFTFVILDSSTMLPDPTLSKYSLIQSINLTTAENLAIGKKSLENNKTGIGNYAIGPDTLYTNTSGSSNTALGFKTLYNNTSGNSNTAIGSYALYSNNGNWDSLYGDQFGSYNTAVGANSLMSNTKGSANTALGIESLLLNTEGDYNTAVGTLAMVNNLTGSSNTATGSNALTYNTSGSQNTAIGTGALRSNTTGSQNTAMGLNALRSNTIGSYNTSIGRSALVSLNSGEQNTALGRRAGLDMVNGENNTFLGALTNVDISGNTYSNSTAIGCGALISASNQIVLGTENETVNIPGKIRISTISTNPIAGKVTLVSGIATINTTSVTSNSLIFLTASTKNANSGFLSYTKIDGVSFTINSSNVLDNNSINWLIIN